MPVKSGTKHRLSHVTFKLCGIYRITNQSDGKTYIGQSRDITERWTKHIRLSKMVAFHEEAKKPLYYAMCKMLNRFKFEIIEQCKPGKLNERELHYIQTENPQYNTNLVPKESVKEWIDWETLLGPSEDVSDYMREKYDETK